MAWTEWCFWTSSVLFCVSSDSLAHQPAWHKAVLSFGHCKGRSLASQPLRGSTLDHKPMTSLITFLILSASILNTFRVFFLASGPTEWALARQPAHPESILRSRASGPWGPPSDPQIPVVFCGSTDCSSFLAVRQPGYLLSSEAYILSCSLFLLPISNTPSTPTHSHLSGIQTANWVWSRKR